MSSRVGRWKREDEAAGEHRVRGRRERRDETEARKRTGTKERERLCGGIPSLPGHPRQLPHFPFSSRVCPMLLRFRVGSGPTEPPSVPLPRAALYPLHPPPYPLLRPHRPCNGDSHHPAHAGLARWRREVVMCTRTTRVHVHAGTHVQPDRCLNPHTPLLKYRPFVFSLPPAFPSHTHPSVLNYAHGTPHSFLSPRRDAARRLQQRNRTELFPSLGRARSRNASPFLRLHRSAKDDPA